MKQKGNIVLVILILVAIIGGLFGSLYIRTQKTDKEVVNPPTTTAPVEVNKTDEAIDLKDWEIYENNHGGYSFLYPQSWAGTFPCKSFTGPECGDGPQTTASVQDPNSLYPDGNFTIEYYAKDYCIGATDNTLSWAWKEVKQSEEIIDGVKAEVLIGKIDHIDEKLYDRKIAHIVKNESCFVLSYWNSNNKTREETLNQIFNSFRFTQQDLTQYYPKNK